MKNKIRWIILLLVFVATGLNFLDRQVLSITILKIQKEFNLNDVQYGMINTSFLISYALMFTIAGRLTELYGGKIGLGFSVLIWSVASGLHGVIGSFYQLLFFRFLLGVGEGGCFPGAAKTVNELFDQKDRAFANGVAIGGSAIGAVLAPPLTILVSNNLGWRWGFIMSGLIGIIWVAVWFLMPWKRKAVTEKKNGHSSRQKPFSFIEILKNKSAFVFIIIRFLLDPVFYFIMFWIPKYLNEKRGVSFDEIGHLLWIPFLALGVSNMLGGWLSDLFIRQGASVNKARKIVMGVAALLTISATMVQNVSSVSLAIALMSLLLLAHGFWITNYITAISDMFGTRGTSTVVGLSGTAGAISGLLVNPLIGWLIQHYSYNPLWLVCGLLYPLAFLIFSAFIPKITLISTDSL
jgi:ACS family hexuronate transporter-like MFS transporter